MSFLVLQNAYILLAANDISDHCSKIGFEVEAAELDSTTFGSSGWESLELGLKKGSISLAIKHDFVAGNIDSIMWPLVGTKVAIVIKAVNAAVSTSNPSFTGTVAISKWSPINGDVGALGETEVQWRTSGAVTRATA